MILALLITAAPPPPTPPSPMQRVTICQPDAGDCRGMGGVSTALTDAQLRASPLVVLVGDAGVLNVAPHAVSVSNFPATQAVTGAFFQATQPVSLASVPTHGVTGAFFQATQPVSIASMPSTPVTGTFWQATQPVSGTFWQATQPISGTITANAGAGTMAVSGPLTDTQLRAAAVPVSLASTTVTGTVAVSGPATDAQLRATALVVAEGSATRWSCFVPVTATATTQCQAAPAAGLRNYVTSVACSNGAATAQGVDVVYGTGAACVTGTTALTHKFQMGTNALTTSPFLVAHQLPTPLVPATAAAICVRPTAATAFGCTLTGYVAP